MFFKKIIKLIFAKKSVLRLFLLFILTVESRNINYNTREYFKNITFVNRFVIFLYVALFF
jgi:hypothetical protein